MWPIAILALWLYYSAFEILFRVVIWNGICSKSSSFNLAYSNFFRGESPEGREGIAGVKERFARLRMAMLSGVNRRLSCLKALCAVSPLLGLLGTVSGMSQSISSASGDYAGVAEGVSKALVTTQAGLVVAIPAWILAIFAGAQVHRLLVNLSRRESEILRKVES